MKPLLIFAPDPSLAACAEFRISVASLPFLADHAFQDMVVLPGSFYVEMALSVHLEIARCVPSVIRNVTFHTPVILSTEDTIIRVEVRNRDSETAEYTFYEAAGIQGPAGSEPYAARLEIDGGAAASQKTADEAFSIEQFQAQAEEVIDAERFYQQLRENGNQYGPRFRCVGTIWRAGDQCLGEVCWQQPENESHNLHPTLLDAMTQLLAPFMMTGGRTFILRSIDRISFADLSIPDAVWCHATRLAKNEGESSAVVGNVRAFGPAGKPYMELAGVSFALMEPPQVAEEKAALKFVVASNFTADQLEDSLRYWAAHFGVEARVKFAPYDQIFQQLLQPESALRKNKDGINVILLQLEKWAAGKRDGAPEFDKENAEQCFGARKRCTLPNGLEIVHLNEYETSYLYKEIFADQCYLKHGIRLRDGATVVDIGANIGLFSLFVMSQCKQPRIYAFEPAPVVYELLKANCNAYGSSARAFNSGVSDKQGTATFAFYENSSVFSSFFPNEAEDREAIQAVVRNMLNAHSVDGESVQDYVQELTTDRLRSQSCECRLTTVSDIIRENQIGRIDLLKIDAEKSELGIIRGIADSDWAKIDQFVIEIHDNTGEVVREINDLLIGKGFQCGIEQEKLLEHSGLFNLFATRAVRVNARERQQAASARGASEGLQQNVGEFCAALQSFTAQTKTPLVLCVCPASPEVEANAERKAAVANAERELLSRASAVAGVSAIGSEALLRRYPVAEYYDVHGHQLGDIPYTAECFAAIGTALFRTVFNLKRKPFKVIVLDCDNTLWKGVCGEDGVQGVVVTEPHRVLQQFMIEQLNAGMLLCLCSKNSEKDVLDIFDQRADMLLKREHLAGWRINWGSKSSNIKSLAKELNLGLESFIFVDDNPVECAEVEINCPGVLGLRLPQNSESFAAFFEHTWAFDYSGTTEEDRSRAKMYQDNARRERFREQSPSLTDFIAGLQVRVEIGGATEEQLGRISQLTFRTNQFNLTTIRRSENEIRDFLRRENADCLTVRVTDRFGNYGLVGVVLYECETDRFKLDTFLLSCRVLGRGVEHTVLAGVGQRALTAGKKWIELRCVPTERNLPARDFVRSLGEQYRSGESWLFPADYVASLQYNPEQQPETLHEEPSVEKPRQTSGFGITMRSEQLQRIGEELYDMSRLAKAIGEPRLRAHDFGSVAEAEPSGSVEAAVLNIWRRVLGRADVGLNVNFFEAGGTSLKAVQVIAMIRKELKQNLSIVSLFESPTINLLAARLSATDAGPSGDPGTEGASLRGRQRRSRAMRRTRS